MNNHEIDALIAEKVMGWTNLTTPSDGLPTIGVSRRIRMPEYVPRYTEDIAAAWMVVETMQGREYSVSMGSWENSGDDNRWYCEFEAHDKLHGHCVPAPTLPLAICLAALKAVGVEVEP